MCFSASASFAVSAALLPVSAFTINYAWRYDKRYLALAAFPLMFGVQQAFEGVLWLSIPIEEAAGLRISALGLLILTSVILSAVFFIYAFVSIWCFFAAVLSLYIIVILRDNKKPELKAMVGISNDHSMLGPR